MIGIMQGRLLPPENGKLQSFPSIDWKSEFCYAKVSGMNCIEWIFDYAEGYQNPLMNGLDRLTIHHLMNGFGVKVRSVCGDYFMRQPFLDMSVVEKGIILFALIDAAHRVNANKIVIPFVDASSLLGSSYKRGDAVALLQAGAEYANTYGISLNLEMDLSPQDFAGFLESVGQSNVFVNYDTGNSASLGYDPVEEFDAYGPLIGSVHIKDRLLGGESVPLGKGNADFPTIFSLLKKTDYEGDYILQTARGIDGNEIRLAISNKMFVKEFLKREN